MTSRAELNAVLLDDLHGWGVPQGACALVDSSGLVASGGDVEVIHPWASVTKIVAALAVLDVVREGRIELDTPAGPVGSTLRHLLGHASGLAFDEDRVVAKPGTRRIYSNIGIDVAVEKAVEAAGSCDHRTLLTERVLSPLGMAETRIVGPASRGAEGPVHDLAKLAMGLLSPGAIDASVVEAATSLSFPSLAGILPGYGRQDPNEWGLGIEIHGLKSPHWMPPTASTSAFGHFGVAGSFLWADPVRGKGAVALTGTAFGSWAVDAWPASLARWLEQWERQETQEVV